MSGAASKTDFIVEISSAELRMILNEAKERKKKLDQLVCSRENPEIHERGLNIYIVEVDSSNNIKLLNPLIKDFNNIYKETRENVVMVKVGHFFEPLYEINKSKETRKRILLN